MKIVRNNFNDTKTCPVIQISEEYNSLNYEKCMCILYVFICEYIVYLKRNIPEINSKCLWVAELRILL